ncbi:cuticle protein-like isoform X3 [Anopheles merus]|uniref:cuticle protein-like isoform X1 n=1 Tax=Anopheles merus TaxID=30066 RepID=UPI001BE4DF04|nr:cuticle protein-like isoform X1 [Anopheles merus]XP_041784605.1 cuticle protein-like isoform X3 [Anopheles merus]
MASKFVLIVASLACVSAGYIPSDHSHLSYGVAPAVSYSNVIKNVAPVPVLSKTILPEPQLYHGYAQIAPSVVVRKPLALTNPLPVSYAVPHSVYQAPALEYTKPLSYGPYAKTVIAAEPTYAKTVIAAEPAYAKTIVSEPIYTKNVFAEPIYPAKTLIAEPVYGKSILAQPAPIYGGKVLSYGPQVAYGGYGAHGW